jgi:hypothetical protein
MNIKYIYLLVVALLACSLPASAQQYVGPDSLGLPGDNLNLFAVLKIFQESPTIEEFEKQLNSEESNVNNLDLDGDGAIDYIRVVDHVVNDVHTIVLQVPLRRNDAQDVAVIEVRRDAEDRVFIQVIGDEALYGRDYIIEPNYDVPGDRTIGETPNPGYAGPKPETRVILDGRPIVVVHTTPREIHGWPIVMFIFRPSYRPWFSPWYYAHYPLWWRPWRPLYWHSYMGFQYHYYDYYYGYYRHWQHYRDPQGVNRYYRSVRSYSPILVNRVRKGAFRETYARPDLRREGMQRHEQFEASRGKGPGRERPAPVPPSTPPQRGKVPQGAPPSVDQKHDRPVSDNPPVVRRPETPPAQRRDQSTRQREGDRAPAPKASQVEKRREERPAPQRERTRNQDQGRSEERKRPDRR